MNAMPSVAPPTEAVAEIERASARRGHIRRRASKDFRRHFSRQGLGVTIVVAVLGALFYWVVEGTHRASSQLGVWILSGAAPVGALVATMYVWSLLRAPLLIARDGLADAYLRVAELTDDATELAAKTAAFEDRLSVARTQLGVELREIRHRIEIVRGTRPHPHYSHDFALPTVRWHAHGDVLAGSLELFRQVEPAYAAVTHLHAALEMRRTRARPGQTLGVIPEDGLDAVYDAAGSALDALGEEHREVWLSDIDRAVAGVVEDLMSEPPSDLETVFAAKYAQALLSAYRDIVNQGEELHLAVERVPPHNPVPSELQERIASWATRCIVWANDTNGPLSHEQRQMFRGAPTGPLPRDLLANIVTDNLNALQAVRDLIEP